MRLSASALGSANLLLAIAIVAVGGSHVVSTLHRLPVEAKVGMIERGTPLGQADLKGILEPLEEAAVTSTAAKADIALALLAGATDASGQSIALRVRAQRAAGELKAYLAEVPGDSTRWAGLASAELLQGHNANAVSALKMSILTAPWSPALLLWRCDAGITLFGSLDDEGRGLLEEQFRVAAERDTGKLVELMKKKQSIPVARILLSNSPISLAKFDDQLARMR